MMRKKIEYGARLLCLGIALGLITLILVSRIFYLGIIKRDFLVRQSNLRTVREISTQAYRGIILDRNEESLAISIPAESIWINPKIFNPSNKEINELSMLLEISASTIIQKANAKKSREFVYLKRSIPTEAANQIMSLKIAGVFREKTYKRFYPEAEAVSQIIGFTNIDDQGQEGLELVYDEWLRGTPGKTRVVKDRLGNVVANLGVIAEPQRGHNLTLSIDRRIQYLAYHELSKAVTKHRAEFGSAVVLSVKTGEILAMANYPSYNPNNRQQVSPANLRNKALTDLFEPGSTIKTFTVAAGLESGLYHSRTLIDTNPGVLWVSKHPIRDDKNINNGVISVAKVLQKSSDIGVSKIALSLPSNTLLNTLIKFGFGQSTKSYFPGEAIGNLPNNLDKRPFVLATLSFGYSLSVTLLQLAKAYAIIGNYGTELPITFVKVNESPLGNPVFSSKICKELIAILEEVVTNGGGKLAKVSGYRVAGKTGTARIASPTGGYYSDRHYSSFAGIAPISDPQLVVAIMLKYPKNNYYGSLVAAPLFSEIMGGTLRILNIEPDDATLN